jgi:hypothetical protein
MICSSAVSAVRERHRIQGRCPSACLLAAARLQARAARDPSCSLIGGGLETLHPDPTARSATLFLTLPFVLEGTGRSTCSGRNGPVNEFFDLDRVATSTPPPPVSPRPPVTVSAPSSESPPAHRVSATSVSPCPTPGLPVTGQAATARGSGSPTRGAAAPRRPRPSRDEQAEQSLRPISNWMMLLAVGAVALLAVANLVAAMHCGNRPGRFGSHRC